MNISGVTHTAPVMPTTQAMGAQETAQATQMPPEAAVADAPASAVAFEAQVSTQVMDIAQNQFEDAANQLISQMAAATGVGQNVDAFV